MDQRIKELPYTSPDPYILAVAADHRLAAKQTLQWTRDAWRLRYGLVEVVDPDSHDGPMRFLPCQADCAPYSHGHMVSDVIQPGTADALDWADTRLASIREQKQAGRMSSRMAALAMVLTVEVAAEKIEKAQR